MTDSDNKNEQPLNARALGETASDEFFELEQAEWTNALAHCEMLGDELNEHLTHDVATHDMTPDEMQTELSLDELSALLQEESSGLIAETYTVVETIEDDRAIELYADGMIALEDIPPTYFHHDDLRHNGREAGHDLSLDLAAIVVPPGEAKNGKPEKPRQRSAQSELAAMGPLMAELVAARAEIRRLEEKAAQVGDQLSRQQNDFNNYRRRVERTDAEKTTREIGETIKRLLPVLDNLERVIQAEKKIETERSEQLTDFLLGVEMIYKQFGEILARMGVEPVASLGCMFDPTCHEAVVTEEQADCLPNTVIEEFQRGYRIGEYLVRPAMVKVATGKRGA